MTKKLAATNAQEFRRFLLMQQFAAQEIGARIAQARLEAGAMTQHELADLLNISARSVQDYEAGIRIPWRYFKQLEEIFRRPMEWFLHGDTATETPEDDPPEEILARLDRIEQILERLVSQPDEGA